MLTKSEKCFVGAILSNLIITKSLKPIAQKNFMALAIYSKDPNVPGICEILMFHAQNPHFNFQNFPILTKQL